MKRSKKRPFTLMEIMIVIFLIGLIGAVVSYNMKGSMDKGRAFKTEQAQRQLEDILNLEMAKQDVDAITVANNPKQYLEASGLVKDAEKLLKDGWGKKFDIKGTKEGQLIIISNDYNEYNKKNNPSNQSTAEPKD